MESNLNLKIEGVQGNELIIRHGEAPKVIEPKSVKIAGDIKSVLNFIKIRIDGIDKQKATIEFNEKLKSVVLNTDPSSPIQTTVVGELEVYEKLDQFGINKEKFYGQNELEKFVRMNRFFFADKEKHGQLVSNLKNLSAKVNAEMVSEKDNRGNRNIGLKKEVKTDLAADFVLSIPLFKNSEPKTFRVEICYELTDSTMRFWLESVELEELQMDAVQKEFSAQKDHFNELGFVVISQ